MDSGLLGGRPGRRFGGGVTIACAFFDEDPGGAFPFALNAGLELSGDGMLP